MDEQKRILQQDIAPGVVKQRHITGSILFSGLAVNRPTNTPLTEVVFYFSTDTNSLSVWNNVSKAWKSTTLS